LHWERQSKTVLLTLELNVFLPEGGARHRQKESGQND
jgi:hypothetical protein